MNRQIESWKTRYNGSILVHFTDGTWKIFSSKRRALRFVGYVPATPHTES